MAVFNCYVELLEGITESMSYTRGAAPLQLQTPSERCSCCGFLNALNNSQGGTLNFPHFRESI